MRPFPVPPIPLRKVLDMLTSGVMSWKVRACCRLGQTPPIASIFGAIKDAVVPLEETWMIFYSSLSAVLEVDLWSNIEKYALPDTGPKKLFFVSSWEHGLVILLLALQLPTTSFLVVAY